MIVLMTKLPWKPECNFSNYPIPEVLDNIDLDALSEPIVIRYKHQYIPDYITHNEVYQIKKHIKEKVRVSPTLSPYEQFKKCIESNDRSLLNKAVALVEASWKALTDSYRENHKEEMSCDECIRASEYHDPHCSAMDPADPLITYHVNPQILHLCER